MTDILEREFLALRQRRVALREGIKRVTLAMAMGADFYSHKETRVNLELTLRGTEKRWAELHALLGRKPAGPPVKLAIPRTAVRYAPAQRRAPAPYLNRMIVTR